MSSVPIAPGLMCDPSKAVKAAGHPIWFPPKTVAHEAVASAGEPTAGRLFVMNSLTDRLEPFAGVTGRTIKWYTCGPTVYDVSHMGHARAYLTFDILRRIMEDYFGYTIDYHLNITDIDDKIIKRARVNKLISDFRAESRSDADTLVAIQSALASATQNLSDRATEMAKPLSPEANSRIREEREEKMKELDLKKNQLNDISAAVDTATAASNVQAALQAALGPLGEMLDGLRGAAVTDHTIFDSHAKIFESKYFADMHRLGVRDPDVLTRVTEFVPEIVDYVQQIMDNGFAYKGETSVFFDTQAFAKAGHSYPKNRKTKEGGEETTADEMAEGEGTLSAATASEKRSPNDFALWKFSKPGEPEWDSPWGKGRPGWHIECSVVASHVLGRNIDIHAGGCDLRFPHHDNELAQSEAYWGEHQWVNYFMHCGHLHIKGLKMSKSLKNFITIQEALDNLGISPRQMRLLFLDNEWNKPMNFSDQSVGKARETERVLRALFGAIEIVLRDDSLLHRQGLINEHDKSLREKCLSVENNVHGALCNNFDTVTALAELMSLVSALNAHLLTGERPNATLLQRAGRYITKMLKIFGVIDSSDDIGFVCRVKNPKFIAAVDSLAAARDLVRSAAAAKEMSELVVEKLNSVDLFSRCGIQLKRVDGQLTIPDEIDDEVRRVLAAGIAFVDELKLIATPKQDAVTLLVVCDQLRDVMLPPLGVRLEDRPGEATVWKTDDAECLLRDLAEKKAAAAAEAVKKMTNMLETKKKLVAKWERVLAPPVDYFRSMPDINQKFSAFGGDGMPSHLADGTAMDDKSLKKLKKELDKYAGQHKDLMLKGGDSFVTSLRAEVDDLQRKINNS